MRLIIIFLLMIDTVHAADQCFYAPASPKLIELEGCDGKSKVICNGVVLCGERVKTINCDVDKSGQCPSAFTCMAMSSIQYATKDAQEFALETAVENRNKLVTQLNAAMASTKKASQLAAGEVEAIADTYAFIMNKVSPNISRERLKEAVVVAVEKDGVEAALVPILAETTLRAYTMGYSAVGDMMVPMIAQLNPVMGEIMHEQVGSPISYGQDFALMSLSKNPALQDELGKILGHDSLKSLGMGNDLQDDYFGLGASFEAMFSDKQGLEKKIMGDNENPAYKGMVMGDADMRFNGFSKGAADNPFGVNTDGFDPQLAIGGRCDNKQMILEGIIYEKYVGASVKTLGNWVGGVTAIGVGVVAPFGLVAGPIAGLSVGMLINQFGDHIIYRAEIKESRLNSECGKTGTGDTGSGKTGTGDTGSGKTGTGDTGSGKTGTGDTGSGKTGTGDTGSGKTGNDKTGGDKTGGTDDPNKKKTTDPGPDDGYEGGLIFIDHDLSGIDPHEGITVPGPDSQGKKNGEASSVMPVSPDDPGHVPEEMKDGDLLLTEEEAKAIKAAKEAGYTDPMPEE